jgi:hypothetical protein
MIVLNTSWDSCPRCTSSSRETRRLIPNSYQNGLGHCCHPWHTTPVPPPVLSELTPAAIQMEATRAYLKEAGEVSEAALLLALNSVLQHLAGRVAHELTYDSGGPGAGEGRKAELARKLIQVAAMAASWVEYLEGGK